MLEDDTGFRCLRDLLGQCSLFFFISFFTAKPPPCLYTGQERILQCRAAKPAFLEEKGENLERPFPENRKGPALILAPLAERHAAHGMDEPLDIPASFETLCFRFLRRVAALPPLSPGRTAAAVMGMGYAAEKSMFPFMFGHPF